MNVNQEEWVTLLRNGDGKGFEQIFSYYFSRLVSFAKTYVYIQEEAADIAQNVLIVLWDKRLQLDPSTNLTGFLLTLTKNRCIDYLRHVKLNQDYEAVEQEHWQYAQLDIIALENFFPETLVWNDLEKAVRNAIHQLPDDCREVFLLHRTKHLKYAEIANQLGVSVKTIEYRMSKALSFLRKELKDYYVLIFFFFPHLF